MFPFPIAKPQKCDIQTFYGADNGTLATQAWNKPVGVSHVYMMLIGAGGDGDGTITGGGSGAVTVWYGAAQHVPNTLIVVVPNNQNGYNTAIYYNGKANYQTLLTANNGASATAGSATTAGPFAASGFYKSTAGQDGVASGAPSPDGATFLSGGGSASATVSNYGYQGSASGGTRGYFQMQPIIVGVGATGANKGGIGCGGGATGIGGPGMVLIASW